MDLRSIINQSSSKGATTAPVSPQPFHHSPPAYQRHETVQSVQHQPRLRERPPQPPPLRPTDHSPGPNPYHAPSPYNTLPSGSTLSTGSHSTHSHSPGSQAQSTSARDVPSLQHQFSNSTFAQSPSTLTRPSPTPTTPQQYQYHQRQTSLNSIAPLPPSYSQLYPSRENSIPPSVLPHSQSSQFSPPPQFISQPGTPLGPPGPYQRPSPQVQKSTSHGYDHYRTFSSGSIGSQHGLDYSERNIASPQQQQLSVEALQRQFSVERERERSQSVSPKTILQPPARRTTSMESAQILNPISKQIDYASNEIVRPKAISEPHIDVILGTPTPISSSQTPKDLHLDSSQPSSTQQSPAPGSTQFPTPKPTPASLPPKPSPMAQKQPSLKRNASVLSGTSASPQPSHKRLRRDEIPIFARSARTNRKPLNLGRNTAPSSRTQPAGQEDRAEKKGERAISGPVNGIARGNAPTNGNVSRDPPPVQDSVGWVPPITNVAPYEDLTRWLCDRIYDTIGTANPPSGGAMFEIEAKLGEIHDIEEGHRLRLPVGTEAVFDKSKFRPTKFESSMNMAQHKTLNEFLNSLVQESHEAPNRTPIMFDHPRESDEFYELTPAGQANLPASILQYLNPRHKPRVRITTNLETLTEKARIIKSRIADFEIYNPQESFDYRISISIESPWEGTNEMLIPKNEGGERNKDRMSYRHLAYQIDLTQVSYPASARKEHELEVEISTEQIRTELAKLHARVPSNYESLVRGFLDNVRILARKGTLK